MFVYMKAVMELAMKVQEAILRAMAKKITWGAGMTESRFADCRHNQLARIERSLFSCLTKEQLFRLIVVGIFSAKFMISRQP
jgi:hypothetical protein